MSNVILHVVDDDLSVRQSLDQMIRRNGWQSQLFASAQEFLAAPRLPIPSCLIVDVKLPGLTGLDLQQRVADHIPVIFITGFDDVPSMVRTLTATPIEFLTKPFSDEVLASTIRAALERRQMASEDEDRLRMLRDTYASLSRREQEVMALVVAGKLNKQVGGELGISEITVKAHRGRVMQKMRARTLPDLVMMAAKLQITATGKS